MFIGMNFINGEFLPHRSEFHNCVGSFPLTDSSEIQEAKEICLSCYYDWNNLIYSERINCIKEINLNFDKIYFFWKLESNRYLEKLSFESKVKYIFENPVILDNKNDNKYSIVYDTLDFFESLNLVISNLISGMPVIIVPIYYRACFQYLAEGSKNVTPLLGVINLLHVNEESICLFQKIK